jgi:hypothetical protein
MAEGTYNLANVIYRLQGDLIKAEKLARETLRIRTRLEGVGSRNEGYCCLLLARILCEQNNMGDETKKLYERSLALCIRYEGPNAVNTAIQLISIGRFHHKHGGMQSTTQARRKEFLLAKPYLERVILIDSMNHGPIITESRDAKFILASILTELE